MWHHPISCIALLAVCLGFVGQISAQSAAREKRPNLVVIMADDMGYECLGCNGSTTYKTPRLDALAGQGTRFLHCHSQPICTPSRVQIMTGIYNNRNYLRFGLLDPRATTFGHVLKKAGYATCIVGKWQLRGGFEAPEHFGFDEYCLWQLTRRPGRYVNPGLEVNGRQVDYRDGEYGPDIVSDYLCDFIERNRKGPFLAYYPMMLPHWPFEPTPDSPDYDKKSAGKKGVGQMKYFADMVAHTDKIVGKIADKLDALGIRENTMLLFTGDNGTYTGITSMLGDVAVRGGKGSTRDNGTHVPLIASWPGTLPAGKLSDALIDFSDVLPTLAELAGAEVPAELDVDGQSFAPLLQGRPFAGRQWIYCWYERNGRRGRESQHIRNRLHKLYADGRFYNVAKDFGEQRPLNPRKLSEELRPVHARLKAELDKKVAVTEEATRILKARSPGARKQKTAGKRSKGSRGRP